MSRNSNQKPQLDPEITTHLESYRRRRAAIAKMPELPPSPPPIQFNDLTPSEFEEDRTHRIGYLQGRVCKAFATAGGNPADGRWASLSDMLSLTCTAGRDGKWENVRLDPSAEDEDVDEVLDQMGVVLAETEEQWAAWETRYERRWNLKRAVEKWKQGVESPHTRRKSPLHMVASANDEPEDVVVAQPEDAAPHPDPKVAVSQPEPEVVVSQPEPVSKPTPNEPTPMTVEGKALPATPKRRSRTARMTTGGKAPKRPPPAPAPEPQVAVSQPEPVSKPTPKEQPSTTTDGKAHNLLPVTPKTRPRTARMSTGGKPPKRQPELVSKPTPQEQSSTTADGTAHNLLPVTPKTRPRTARMSTGGKPPKRQPEPVASTSATPKVVNIVSTTAPDPLRDSAPFGFGVVKRASVKGKEKAKEPTNEEEKERKLAQREKERKSAERRLAKEAEELKKREERVQWELARDRKLRDERVKELEKYNKEKERREKEKERERQEAEREEARQQEELEDEIDELINDNEKEEEIISSRLDNGKGKATDDIKDEEDDHGPMLIHDVSEMSFIPPSFPSSIIGHSTPKPLPQTTTRARPTKPFGLRNSSPPPSNVFDFSDTVTTPRAPDDKAKASRDALPNVEASSYAYMDSSTELPSRINLFGAGPTTIATKKRARPASPSPSPSLSPIIRKEPLRPEKKARHDVSPSRERQVPIVVEDVTEISFLPPSFPPGGIMTSTPKPHSKSKSKSKSPSKTLGKTTPATRPFLLPAPSPASRVLADPLRYAKQPLPTFSSPSRPAKRAASPTTPLRAPITKKAKTLAVPSSPTASKQLPRDEDKTTESSVVVAGVTTVQISALPGASSAVLPPVTSATLASVLKATGMMDLVDVPMTPQRKRSTLPTLTELLASSSRSRKGKGSASAKKLRKSLVVRTPSGDRIDLVAMKVLTVKNDQKAKEAEKMETQEKDQEQQSLVQEESAKPSTLGTAADDFQLMKAAANASSDFFLHDSIPPFLNSSTEDAPAPAPEAPAAMDPYSDAYHFAEDIVVPTGRKLRTLADAGGSYPFAMASGSADPYADNPYDDPYASAGEHVGISPTKSLSSLAGSESDSDAAPDDSDDGMGGGMRAYRRTTEGFGEGAMSPGFVFDPVAASTQVPPGLTFGVGFGGGGAGGSGLFGAAAGTTAAAVGADGGAAACAAPGLAAADGDAKQADSQASRDSWASMYVSSEGPASGLPAVVSAKEPSPQYAPLPEHQPSPLSSSPACQPQRAATPPRVPSSSNPFFSFSSQAFGDNIAKHVDMVSRLLDKDVDFNGWLKDPEEVDEGPRDVEESP